MTSGPVTQSTPSGRQYTGGWIEKIRLANVADGSSNTFLAGEMHIPDGKLNQFPYNGAVLYGVESDNHSRVGGSGVPILSSNEETGAFLGFGSAHPSQCNFVRADGSTGSVSNDLDTVVLANLCNRSDGEVVGAID